MMNRSWLIWMLCAVFYLYEFALRVTPSLMVPQLMRGFSLDAFGVGSMAAFYFYGYGILQWPVGMLADRYGVRLNMSLACLLCAGGTVLFSFSTSYALLSFSRLLMGCGSAFAYVSTLYVIRVWFDKNQYGLLSGLTNAMGVLGAIFAENAVVFGIDVYGWRMSMAVLGLLGVLIAFMLYQGVEDAEPVQTQSVKSQVLAVLKQPWLWVVAVMVGLLHFTLVAFGAMWGVSYVQAAYDLSLATAAGFVSVFYIGAIFGGALLGRISDKLNNRLIVIIASALIGALVSYALFSMQLSLFMARIALIIIGFCSAGFGLGYAYMLDYMPPAYSGSAAGFMNTVLIAFSALSLPLVGYLLDLGRKVGNVYSVNDYDDALMTIPASFILVAILAYGLLHFSKKGHTDEV